MNKNYARSIGINTHRIYAIASLFSRIGIDGVRIFEDLDPQYRAIKHTLNHCKFEVTILAFYLNSLVAYRLKMVGEDFWRKFADFLVQRCNDIMDIYSLVELVKIFTQKYNNYLYWQKIERLDKIKRCGDLLNQVYVGTQEFLPLAEKTAKCLRSSVEAKTVVFSIKMIYYVLRAQGINIILPSELPIPVDRRIAYISYTSGVVKVSAQDINNVVELMLKNSSIVREAWSRVSTYSRIPSLHIDAVLWYFGKFYTVKTIDEVLRNVDAELYAMLGKDLVENLVKELFYVLNKY